MNADAELQQTAQATRPSQLTSGALGIAPAPVDSNSMESLINRIQSSTAHLTELTNVLEGKADYLFGAVPTQAPPNTQSPAGQECAFTRAHECLDVLKYTIERAEAAARRLEVL